jgi:protein TonB
MQNWVRKVERVGNLNYPEEARNRGLAGKVRVAVLINDKGGIEGVEILESSGLNVLDDAVVRIVRLASPFGAFTDSMKQEADQFEIIRTFDFGKRISSF